MTDKEQRILVVQDGSQEACDLGITRAEAVERMAKALWDRDQNRMALLYKDFVTTSWDTLERPCPNAEIYLQMAHAALDALLNGF